MDLCRQRRSGKRATLLDFAGVTIDTDLNAASINTVVELPRSEFGQMVAAALRGFSLNWFRR